MECRSETSVLIAVLSTVTVSGDRITSPHGIDAIGEEVTPKAVHRYPRCGLRDAGNLVPLIEVLALLSAVVVLFER